MLRIFRTLRLLQEIFFGESVLPGRLGELTNEERQAGHQVYRDWVAAGRKPASRAWYGSDYFNTRGGGDFAKCEGGVVSICRFAKRPIIFKDGSKFHYPKSSA